MRLHKIDAQYMIESLRLRTESLIHVIEFQMSQVEQEQQQQQQANADQATYISNLETLVKELTDHNAELASAAIIKSANPAPKKRARKAKAEAPWGYKKDGTPKKRPGRQTMEF